MQPYKANLCSGCSVFRQPVLVAYLNRATWCVSLLYITSNFPLGSSGSSTLCSLAATIIFILVYLTFWAAFADRMSGLRHLCPHFRIDSDNRFPCIFRSPSAPSLKRKLAEPDDRESPCAEPGDRESPHRSQRKSPRKDLTLQN